MMRILQLLLAGCLVASLGCDVDNIVSLDTEMLTVSVTTVGANLDAEGYLLSVTASTSPWRTSSYGSASNPRRASQGSNR